jgi:hypothetical protein
LWYYRLPNDGSLPTWDRFVKLVINQFTLSFTVTPRSKPTQGGDMAAPKGAGNKTILAARGEVVMSTVVHSGVLMRAGGLSTGGTGLSPGVLDNGRGVSLVARTLDDDDVLAKGDDVSVIRVGMRTGAVATMSIINEEPNAVLPLTDGAVHHFTVEAEATYTDALKEEGGCAIHHDELT